MADLLNQILDRTQDKIGRMNATSANFVKWTDPGVEPAVADEKEKTDQVIEAIHGVQEKNFAEHRHGMRGTHVKTQGIVKGTLTVANELPDYLAHGIFKQKGKTYDVAARLANEPHKVQDDRAPGPRGMSMKVFGVDGEFLDPSGDRTKTQDFTFNNAPVLELRDVTTTAEIISTRLRNWDNPDGLQKALEQRDDTELQKAPAQLPNQHFLSYTMYSQSAYRFGDLVAKYALFPSTKLQQQLSDAGITEQSDPEQHSRWLQEFFAEHDAEYDFRVQLARDIAKQSVEDCSVEWAEADAPFETVGRVVFPKGQDPMDARRRTFWDDHMKVNVWYGLVEHQPLGSANRLRKRLYQASSAKREATNAVQLEEVKSVAQIP